MIDTTINLLVNRTECTNLPGTTLTLRLAVKSDNSSPAIHFRDSEKLDATIKLSLTLPTATPRARSQSTDPLTSLGFPLWPRIFFLLSGSSLLVVNFSCSTTSSFSFAALRIFLNLSPSPAFKRWHNSFFLYQRFSTFGSGWLSSSIFLFTLPRDDTVRSSCCSVTLDLGES